MIGCPLGSHGGFYHRETDTREAFFLCDVCSMRLSSFAFGRVADLRAVAFHEHTGGVFRPDLAELFRSSQAGVRRLSRGGADPHVLLDTLVDVAAARIPAEVLAAWIASP